jgi:hypothetical protein
VTSIPRAWPFAVLTVLVVLAAGGTGLFFGALASFPYDPGIRKGDGLDERERRIEKMVWLVGPLLGGSMGAATGLAWSLIMIRRAHRRPPVPLIGFGTLLGIAAGTASTMVLHAGLLITTALLFPEVIVTIFFCMLIIGAPAGAAVGAICGGLCELARRRAFLREEAP